METKIKNLISELKKENSIRAEKLNNTKTDYEHTVLVHQYNLTINFIKRLEQL
jgi:hypothetical protein